MTIDDLKDMAELIHDTEGYRLDASSTREYRNAFWARVIGCAYHGHPRYNSQPDRQWHLKKASADRPQTDDVATSLPSRNHWDCISGVGSNGYKFEVTFHGVLPNDQIVYAPPVPDDYAPEPIPPQPPVIPPFPPRDETLVFGLDLNAHYRSKGAGENGTLGGRFASTPRHLDLEGEVVWLSEYLRRRQLGESHHDATAHVLADVDAAWPK